MAAGALDEVAALRELDLAPGLPALGALGVEPLLAHLAGGVPLEAAIATAKTATRHYAKRQITWVRRHMMSWNLIYPQQTGCYIADKIALAAQSDVDPLEPVV